MWLCQCDCGNTRLAEARRLIAQSYKGCEECGRKLHRYDNLTGQMFGYLEAVNPTDKRSGSYIIWNCFCHNCNTYHLVSSGDLKKGQLSCGCIKSKGQGKIKYLLMENNIEHLTEFKFPNLVSDLQRSLRFDFAVLKDSKLRYLIEYDGKQHIKVNEFFGGEEEFKKLQYHDNLKNQYCLSHNIPLIRIPYTQYEKLTIEMLKPETTDFLIK